MPVNIAQAAASSFAPVGITLSIISIIVLAVIIILNVKRKKGFFTTLFETFVPRKYAELKDKSFGQSIGFYALFSLVFILIGVTLISTVLSVYLSNTNYFVPEMTVIQGKVWLEQEPYYVKDIVYASTKEFNPELRTEPMIITKNKIITRDDRKGETRIFDLSKVQYFKLSDLAAKMQTRLFSIWFIVALVMLIFFGLVFFAYNLVYFLILGAVLLLNNAIFKRKLEYHQYFNLAVFSDFPIWILVTLLFWITSFVGLTRFSFAYLIIHLLLISLLVKWLSEKKKSNRKRQK